jgi:hypothetical protein
VRAPHPLRPRARGGSYETRCAASQPGLGLGRPRAGGCGSDRAGLAERPHIGQGCVSGVARRDVDRARSPVRVFGRGAGGRRAARTRIGRASTAAGAGSWAPRDILPTSQGVTNAVVLGTGVRVAPTSSMRAFAELVAAALDLCARHQREPQRSPCGILSEPVASCARPRLAA